MASDGKFRATLKVVNKTKKVGEVIHQLHSYNGITNWAFSELEKQEQLSKLLDEAKLEGSGYEGTVEIHRNVANGWRPIVTFDEFGKPFVNATHESHIEDIPYLWWLWNLWKLHILLRLDIRFRGRGSEVRNANPGDDRLGLAPTADVLLRRMREGARLQGKAKHARWLEPPLVHFEQRRRGKGRLRDLPLQGRGRRGRVRDELRS